MVYRWKCRHCGFSVWAPKRSVVIDSAKEHLFEHHRDLITKDGFQFRWECPYCNIANTTHEKEECVNTFQNHLFSHAKPLLESDAHVSDDISGKGNILVLNRKGKVAGDNARVHFLSGNDIVIIVTASPGARIRMLSDDFSQWPALPIIVTTHRDPLNQVKDIDLSNVPLEVVQVAPSIDLAKLGQTISRVVERHSSAEGQIAIEFDILSELIDKYELKKVFRFLHILGKRFETVDGLAHYEINPEDHPDPTLNVLKNIFDLVVEVQENKFTTAKSGP